MNPKCRSDSINERWIYNIGNSQKVIDSHLEDHNHVLFLEQPLKRFINNVTALPSTGQ